MNTDDKKIIEKNNHNEYAVRKNKVDDLYNKNISAWPNGFISNKKSIIDVKNADFSAENEALYEISGRIKNIREHGKSLFLMIYDETETIQLYAKKEDNQEDSIFDYIKKYLDVGDIVEIVGTLFLTKTAEKTIRIKSITLLSKCLHAIPSDYVGLENIELRYRKRYLDMLVNKDVMNIFKKRTKLVSYIRNFLDNNDYLEVETPMLHTIPGGALAKPFITHHNALDMELYLRIAPELYLKRLVVAGFHKVYEINKNFRNEGVSIRHNPEFTMLECYTAYKDYKWAMDFTERILRESCFYLNGSYVTHWNDYTINFEESFDRLTPQEAILKYTNITLDDLREDSINKFFDHESEKKRVSHQEKIFYLFEEYAEKKLIKPTFLIDFPIQISPLAKANPHNDEIACRFELFICGMEIANGYNELNNPFIQKMRFEEQVKNKDAGNDEAMHFDADFINALEYGMPPTAGVGIGIDRLSMLLTGAQSIKDVILFPTMKKI